MWDKARSAVCILGLLLLGGAVACSGNEPADEGRPVSTGGGTSQPAAGGEAVQYAVPQGWIEVQPTSSMRKAQFRLPKVEGDPEDGEMVAFYFGPGQGGSVDANVSRWISQFSRPDGAPISNDAKVTTRQVAGKNITVVDVSGIYSGASVPMMQGGAPKPDFRMLAAIIETSQGPWFYKLTGPRPTIERWEPSFDEFVMSLRAQ
jgi:hypothetical protein